MLVCGMCVCRYVGRCVYAVYAVHIYIYICVCVYVCIYIYIYMSFCACVHA